MTASSRNSLFQRGKWRLETACAAHDDGSRHFSEGPFRILGLRFCRCVKKEQNQRGVGRSSLQSWRIAAVAETGGEERSTEIKTEILKRAGTSRAPRQSSLRRRQCQFVSPFGSIAIIASLPLLASFRARAEPVVLTRKTIRIIYRDPSASRPLPSKTHRDTNLEGFFWRCL